MWLLPPACGGCRAGAVGPQPCPALLPGAALGGGKGRDMRVLLALCPHVPVSPEPPCPELQASVGCSLSWAASAPVLWELCPGLFCLPAAGGTGAPKNTPCRRKAKHGTQSSVQQVKKAKLAHSPGELRAQRCTSSSNTRHRAVTTHRVGKALHNATNHRAVPLSLHIPEPCRLLQTPVSPHQQLPKCAASLPAAPSWDLQRGWGSWPPRSQNAPPFLWDGKGTQTSCPSTHRDGPSAVSGSCTHSHISVPREQRFCFVPSTLSTPHRHSLQTYRSFQSSSSQQFLNSRSPTALQESRDPGQPGTRSRCWRWPRKAARTTAAEQRLRDGRHSSPCRNNVSLPWWSWQAEGREGALLSALCYAEQLRLSGHVRSRCSDAMPSPGCAALRPN